MRSKPRIVNARTAARFFCAMKANSSGTRAEFEGLVKQLCPDPVRQDFTEEEAQALAAAEVETSEAITALEDNTATLEFAFTFFRVINGLLSALNLITLLPFPQLRIVRAPAAVARVAVAAQIQRNITQRAANDATIVRIRSIREALRKVA